MSYNDVINSVGGKAHFSWIVATILISVAFFLKTDTNNFATFAMCIMSLAGVQHARSIFADKYQSNNANPDETPDETTAIQPKIDNIALPGD